MIDDEFIIIGVCLLCVVVLVTVISVVYTYNQLYVSKMSQLSQYICEERYNMDFDDFDGKILKCKPKKEKYDGIEVQIFPRR